MMATTGGRRGRSASPEGSTLVISERNRHVKAKSTHSGKISKLLSSSTVGLKPYSNAMSQACSAVNTIRSAKTHHTCRPRGT